MSEKYPNTCPKRVQKKKNTIRKCIPHMSGIFLNMSEHVYTEDVSSVYTEDVSSVYTEDRSALYTGDISSVCREE